MKILHTKYNMKEQGFATELKLLNWHDSNDVAEKLANMQLGPVFVEAKSLVLASDLEFRNLFCKGILTVAPTIIKEQEVFEEFLSLCVFILAGGRTFFSVNQEIHNIIQEMFSGFKTEVYKTLKLFNDELPNMPPKERYNWRSLAMIYQPGDEFCLKTSDSGIFVTSNFYVVPIISFAPFAMIGGNFNAENNSFKEFARKYQVKMMWLANLHETSIHLILQHTPHHMTYTVDIIEALLPLKYFQNITAATPQDMVDSLYCDKDHLKAIAKIIVKTWNLDNDVNKPFAAENVLHNVSINTSFLAELYGK